MFLETCRGYADACMQWIAGVRYVFNGQEGVAMEPFSRFHTEKLTEEGLQEIVNRCAQNTMLITSASNGEDTIITHLGPFLLRFMSRLASKLGQETASKAFEASKAENFAAHFDDNIPHPPEPMSYQHNKNKESILPQNPTQPK